MMVKSHVVGLIEAPRGHYPEYEEKLLEDLTQLDLPEEPPGKRSTRKVTKQAAAMKKLTKQKKPEGTIPDMIPQLSLRGQAQAVEYNLGDMEQVARLNQYLASNAFLELFQTPKNGQCLFASVRRGFNVKEEWRNNHCRFQVVEFMALNHGFCFTVLKTILEHEYGAGDTVDDPDIPGPFSFLEYMLYMLQEDSWGDQACILTMSMMWQLPITVVTAEDLGHLKFRHDRPLKEVDLVLVYAGRSYYLGTCEYMYFLIHTIFWYGMGPFDLVRGRLLAARGRWISCGDCYLPLYDRVPGSTGDHLTHCAGLVQFVWGPSILVRVWCWSCGAVRFRTIA